MCLVKLLPMFPVQTEKLRAIEKLWSDLCKNEEDIPVPDWHRQALSETKRRYENGLEEPMDWETAKDLLQKRFK